MTELRRRLLAVALASATAVSLGLVGGWSPTALAQVPTTAIVNGGFETGSFSGWSRHRHTSIVSPGRTGSFAAMVGSTNRTNGDSSISQTFVAPVGGRLLSFWYNVTCPGSSDANWATATLHDATANTTTTVLSPICVPASGWQQVTAPITPGRSYTLTLLTRDDHTAGQGTHTRFDDVTVQGLDITQTASPATVAPGDTVAYTVTATNTGQTTYSPAGFSLNLAAVLDDAAQTGGVTASTGTAMLAGQTLTWSGSLAPGVTATVTFSVTVQREVGDRQLASTVTSTSTANNCQAGSTDPRCTVQVPIRELVITHESDLTTVLPGGQVEFTTTVTNTGRLPYYGGALVVDATGAYDDAVPDGNLTATSGVLFAEPDGWSWTGDLDPEDQVTVTGTVTAVDPPAGDQEIVEVVTSSTVGTNCPAGGADPRCTASADVLAPGLILTKSADVAQAALGQTVTYTVVVTNTGDFDYPEAVVVDDLTGVLDNASYNDDAAGSEGGDFNYDAPELTWIGPVPAGQSVTLTYSVTVVDDLAGDNLLVNRVSSEAPGSTCPPGAGNPVCTTTVAVLAPGLAIEKTASRTSAAPGYVVSYTVVATNTGQVPADPAVLNIDITGVLEDATLTAGPGSTTGSISVSDGVITWSVPLPAGESATLTYGVTVDPSPAGSALVSTVTSPTAGSNCPEEASSPDPRCGVTVPLVVADAIEILAETDVGSAAPGEEVGYTVTVRNVDTEPVSGAAFTMDLQGLLDDADVTFGPAADLGSAGILGGVLSWTGDLDPAQLATVTFTATVDPAAPDDPLTGDGILGATVESSTSGSTCPGENSLPWCQTSVTVSGLLIEYESDVATVLPGGQVRFTATVTNTGTTPYLGLVLQSLAGESFDDVIPNGDQTATIGGDPAGVLQITAEGVVWIGDLPVGATLIIDGTVTAIDPPTGDGEVFGRITTTAAGSNCPPDGDPPDSRCTVTVLVQAPELTITKAADPAEVVPGGTVSYTVTISNAGEYDYPAATVTDDLTTVLDDAEFDDNVEVETGPGSVEFVDGVITWTGPLAVGQSAVVTYSVTADAELTVGDKYLVNRVASADPGSTCPPGGLRPECTTVTLVLTPALTISKIADPPSVAAGAEVTYTVAASNTGQVDYDVAYELAELTDDLNDVLVGASFDDNAVADDGSPVSFEAGVLTWEGEVPVGETVTITYSVTTDGPAAVEPVLTNVVTSETIGANCPPASEDPRCRATVEVLSPELTLLYTTPVESVVKGDVVPYSIVLSNTGPALLTDAEVTADLTEVLEHATLAEQDINATAGEAELVDAELTWNGDLDPGDVAVVGFIVTTVRPATADSVSSEVASDAPGSNCPPESVKPECVTVVQLEAETISIIGLTENISMAGQPGETVTELEAVTMRVDTNAVGGFALTVEPQAEVFTGAATGATFPVAQLLVRESDLGTFAPVVAGGVTVFSQPFPTFPGDPPDIPPGDPVLNDLQITVPPVPADTYQITLEYIATTLP